MTATLVTLAFAGIRSRLLASALTILLSSAAAATIVLALEVGGTARDPWQRTFDAANGAHVLANVPSRADARAIATQPGVAERGEPVPMANVSVAPGGGTDRLLLTGLRSPAQVNKPVRTDGAAPPADGIVLERSFADALGLRVGSARSATRRSTRFTVLHAIQSGAPSPAPRSRLANAIARAPLPVPLELGLKDLLARRRRALRLGSAIAVTGAAIVFALSMKASLDARPAAEISDVTDELPVLVYTLDAVLLVITTTTLVAIALLSVRERIGDYGVLKTIGLTPGQIASSVVSAHAALALIAALLSIPIGIALFRAVYGIAGADSEGLVIAPWWSLTLVPIATLLVVAGATSLPARLATRIPTADALRYE